MNQLKNRFFLVESDPALSLAREYVSNLNKHKESIRELLKDLPNVEKWSQSHEDGQLFGVIFKEDADGKLLLAPKWRKPNKRGVSIPYRNNKEWVEKIRNAPKHKSADKTLCDFYQFPEIFSRDCHKTGEFIRGIWNYGVYLHGYSSISFDLRDGKELYCFVVIDFEAAIEEEKKKYDLIDKVKNFRFNFVGCREISETEWHRMTL